MNTIEFRAWNKKNGGMIYDIQNQNLFETNLITHFDYFLDETFEIMQLWRIWKGVKLFVGDIVKIGGYLRVIRFEEENAMFCFANVCELKHESWKYINQSPNLDWWQKYAENIEVIGNIYQNPELLSE